MNHIFLDTNIIQHTINHNDKEKFLDLHQFNIDFYNQSNVFLLPQVITELDEMNFSYNEWIFKILKINKLDDFEEFNLQLIYNIWVHIFIPSIFNPIKYIPYLKDTIYILENTYWNWREYIEWITEIKEILWIDSNKLENKNIWNSLANLIENTTLWNEKYNLFTYKDIYRTIGNFMYDYKNYQQKSDKQKLKVGKDSQIVFEICLWVNILWID